MSQPKGKAPAPLADGNERTRNHTMAIIPRHSHFVKTNSRERLYNWDDYMEEELAAEKAREENF